MQHKKLERNQIPFLVRLLDDDSKFVRERIRQDLRANTEMLEEELCDTSSLLAPQERTILLEFLDTNSRELFRKNWLRWLDSSDTPARLEQALASLANWIGGHQEATNLSLALDTLAEGAKEAKCDQDPADLGRYLFRDLGFKGDNTDYYNPKHSNLLHVIESRKGIPISLACIFLLTARRLGLSVEGYNLPGHFLAYAITHGEGRFVDCFNGGRLLTADEVSSLLGVYTGKLESQIQPASSEAIVARFLRNLEKAYKHLGDTSSSMFMLALMKDLKKQLAEPEEETLGFDTGSSSGTK